MKYIDCRVGCPLFCKMSLMDFIIGHMLRLYAKVTQKNLSFIFILAPHIGRAVGAHGKTAQKWSKKYQISKLAGNPSKSGKRLKPKAISWFLRDLRLIKVVSVRVFGTHRAIFGHAKMGTFAKFEVSRGWQPDTTGLTPLQTTLLWKTLPLATCVSTPSIWHQVQPDHNLTIWQFDNLITFCSCLLSKSESAPRPGPGSPPRAFSSSRTLRINVLQCWSQSDSLAQPDQTTWVGSDKLNKLSKADFHLSGNLTPLLTPLQSRKFCRPHSSWFSHEADWKLFEVWWCATLDLQ